MKATLKLLIATFVTAIGITFPILATDTAILADDTAVRIFQAGTSNTICELQRSADNPNIYTGTATKAEIIKAANGNENYFQAKLNISIGTEILKCDYQSYFLGTTTPFPTTAIEYSTDKTDQTYFGVECPYEKFLFTVEVTSPTTATLLITDKTPTPMSMILNGESLSWCEDINEAGDYIEYGNIQVDDGETKSIQVKIGVDTYGVDATAGNNPMTFDAGNFGKQEKTAVLTKGADAVVLDINGLYTVAVVKNGSERHLSITKAAAGDEMTFGETGLVYDESAREWSGKVTLTDDQTLPALTYTNHIDPTKSHTYYFPSDIDDEKGDKTQTVTLTDNSSDARCKTGGTYRLTVKLNSDGTATATYINTTPPVEIKDLYLCVYDKNLSNGQFTYDNAGEFSVDYKVTSQLADGSYVIAVHMDCGQTFYLMNNGKAYRPKDATDAEASFGKDKNHMVTFSLVPSDDTTLRKRVSWDKTGYRMLIITPNGSNLDVKGYQITPDESNRMNVVESLAKPTNDLGHMADVFIKFTNPTGKAGYRDDWCKMQLNPSGTHALYDLPLKKGQTFEIYRGREGADGSPVAEGKIQYGSDNALKDGESYLTITDGDRSYLGANIDNTLHATYSLERDGKFTFVVFYTTAKQMLTISRKVQKDRGIKIAVYDQADKLQGELVDMQYKNKNRRNLMTVQVPKGGYVKFGFPDKNEPDGLDTIQYYNIGHSNEAGYNTEAKPGQKKDDCFKAIDSDYAAGDEKCWYRFRMRLREDGSYYLTYQPIPMPEKVWLYVNPTDGPTGVTAEATYTAVADDENPGHYVFQGVTIKKGDNYYFTNQENGRIDGDTSNGLIWYSAHTSSLASTSGAKDDNPVKPGRNINMFSHLNVGTDYNEKNEDGKPKYQFNPFTYLQEETLNNISIDMNIATMSHRYSYDYKGEYYQLVGSCVDIQATGNNDDWHDVADERYRFIYHPTTGYYTCYVEYLWGDWMIYNRNETHDREIHYYAFNLNNVIHELNQPYYLTDGQNRYISDAKKVLPSGSAAEFPILTTTDKETGEITVPTGSEKERYMVAMAPGAVSMLQGFPDFIGGNWDNSPVYKDVTIVFDPANNVLWLTSGREAVDDSMSDPYGELYLVFADVEPEEWAKAREEEIKNGDAATQGEHWVKLTPDPTKLGRYTAKGIKFVRRKNATHSSYFFSNRLGKTLAETIRYSNSYHAGPTDPELSAATYGATYNTADETMLYGSVFTKLNYNEAGNGGNGSFVTDEKPMNIINPSDAAYASTVYVRRWDNKENAPFEDCIINGNSSRKAIRRTAAAETNTDGTGNTVAEPTPDGNIYVTTTDDEPERKEGDIVVRTFASEPYPYDVTVDLGRQTFTLETTPQLILTAIKELPADTPSRAVIRAAAGHITVTGAQRVSIYTISGRCLLLNAGEADMDAAPGIYIIVADGKASKHLL